MENLHIPPAPKDMFLNEKQENMPLEGVITQKLEKMEYIPFMGIQVHAVGGLYPKKGFPTPEAIHAINQVKVVTLEAIKFPLLFVYNLEKLLTSYNKIANKALKAHYMKEQYFCPTAYTINNIILLFLTRIGVNQTVASDFAFNFAHIVEYDDAYRYRIQDLVTESSFDRMKANPRKEIERLVTLATERDNPVISIKFKRISTIIRYALLIPKYKKAFLYALEGRFERMKFDTADWYWVCMRDDYLFGGKKYEERKTEFTQYPQLYQIVKK